MSNEAKPTPGPYSLNGFALEADLDDGTEVIAHFYSGDERPPSGDANANAKVGLDAFNVLHETGLTPRQIAKRRAELLVILGDVLKQATNAAEGKITPEQAYDYMRCLGSLESPRAAIAKCAGKAVQI